MKTQQILLFSFLVLLLSACAGFSKSLRTNPFEQRIPIKLCEEQVPVIDPDPVQVVGLNLDQDKKLWLLTPQVKLSSSYVKSEDDAKYLERKSTLIRNFIESKFEQERWAEGEIPIELPDIVDSLGNNVIASELIRRIEMVSAVDYETWKVDPRLYSSEIDGYSLLMFVNGQIGFERMSDNLNEFYWFIIDNETGKVSYADYFKYDCDIRNYDGLDKVVEYAFIKFVAIRYPEFAEGL